MSSNDYLPDRDRRRRIGLDEAVFCSSKSVDQIAAILRTAENNGDSHLLTRLEPAEFDALPAVLRASLDYDRVSATAWYGTATELDSNRRVAIVTGGTSDLRVSTEAKRTLAWHGVDCTEFNDVGVAGLWRLTERIDAIAAFPIVIAVAGMDAALPTVLGGLVASSIIAVPTSTGYGAAQHGQTALNALLASCAPGLAVVNIDNGYGAACAAIRSLNAIHAGDET